MDAAANSTEADRISDREVVATRTINGPASTVYEAWTNAELVQQWWVPKSFPISLVGCELDVRAAVGRRARR